jgi:phosphatidylinositol glycan class B
VLAAFFSRGYYDTDEQFQVLEFLNARLGRAPYSGLAWEYQKQMRSWVQPMIYELPTRALIAIGVSDPFDWAFAIRLLTALVGWLSIVALARCCRVWFEDRRWSEWAVRLLCLFWFLPFLHARTSSESLAGSFFVLAVAWVALTLPRAGTMDCGVTRGRLTCAGALLGLSFFCRFQMGIAIAAFGAGLVLIERMRDRRLVWLGSSFAAALALGTCLDSWGYGHWVFTPWNYFDQNLLQGAAASVGRSPWDYYFTQLWEQIPPLGALVLVGVIAGWIARPRHMLSYTSIAFVAAHSWIAHKESRFAFPIAAFAPVLAAFALARLRDFRFPRALRVAVAILLVFDAGVLFVVSLKPAVAQIGFYQAVFRHEPPIRELYRGELDPYSPFGLPIAFYRPDGLTERTLHTPAELLAGLSAGQDAWLFYENFELTGDAAGLAAHCSLEYTTYPAILHSLTFLAGPRRFANRWSLYRCRL